MTQKNKKNNLTVVCSGTKGIGKTWFSSVLSQSLGILKQKVLFFDADGGVENIAFQLNLPKSTAYDDMLKNKITLNNAVNFCFKGYFDMIYAEPQNNGLSAYPAGRCQILVSDLKAFSVNYDTVLADCSNTNSTLKNSFLQAADRIILLIGPNLNGNIDAYKELEHIKKITANPKIFVVVNRALSYNEGCQIFKTLLKADAQFIGANPLLLGVIKQDGRIRDCIANKSSLFERYPVCDSLNDISNFAKTLITGEKQNAL